MAETISVIPHVPTKGKYEKIGRKIVRDSLVLYSDSLYSKLELEFKEVSKNEFQSYKRKYKTECTLDSGNFISGSGLYVSRKCDEICETYLSERTTNRKMLLPSTYDAGVLGMLLSPNCGNLIVCSSYDGLAFEDYYEDRAEVFVFTVTTGKGVKGIKPSFKFFTKDWSIEDLTWVSDNSIALKTYEENRTINNQDNLHYKYFKADLNKIN